MRYLKVIILHLLSAIVLIILFGLYFLWNYHIDETVTQGEKYGLTIGDSKVKSFEKLSGAVAMTSLNSNIAIFIKLKDNKDIGPVLASKIGQDVLIQTYLNKDDFENFDNIDVWHFYLGASYWNVLSLKFCNNKLCEIYRHRQLLELP